MRSVSADADRRRDHRHLRHGRQREADRRRADGRRGGDRLGAGGGGLRAGRRSSRRSRTTSTTSTRFLVIGRRPLSAAPADKTTIVFTLPNEPGALFKALSVFALRGIDLTKLESRPIPGRKWEYLFYADLAAARDDLPCARALAHLGRVRADAARARLVSELQATATADTPAAQILREARVTRPTRIESADHRRRAARPRAPC